MRKQLVLVLCAALLVAIICALAPQLNLTLNEDGTDVIAVDLSGIATPKQAIAAEPR